MSENATKQSNTCCSHSRGSIALAALAASALFYPNYSQGIENILMPEQSFFSVFKMTFNQYGFSGLYRGWLTKVMQDMAYHGLQIAAYKKMCSQLTNSYRTIQCPLIHHEEFHPVASGSEIGCILASGIGATILLHPLNVIFSNLIAQRTLPAMEVIRQLFRVRGTTCILRGLFPAICQSAIGSLVYIYLTPIIQQLIKDTFKKSSRNLNIVMTEIVCALISNFLSSPFQFAQTLLSTHTHFQSTFDCWRQMISTTNSWGSLWSGFLGTTLYRIPNDILLFCMM